jgi:hypothetical protein
MFSNQHAHRNPAKLALVNIGLFLDNDIIRNALRYSRDDSRYRIDMNEAEQLQSKRSKDAEELANLETNKWHSRRKYSMQQAVTLDVQDSVIPEQLVRELEAGADRKGTLHEEMGETPEADRETLKHPDYPLCPSEMKRERVEYQLVE